MPPPLGYDSDAEGPQECGGVNTGELCGSMFWLKFNQRFHRLDPTNEEYTAEIERSIYNVGISAQVPGGASIRYFARLLYAKQPGYRIGTCCEGQGTRMFGSLPEYVYSLSSDHKSVYVNLFAASTIKLRSGARITQATSFPAGSGDVSITVSCPQVDCGTITLWLRSPGWLAIDHLAVSLKRSVGGGASTTTTSIASIARGSYGAIERGWSNGDTLTFTLARKLRIVKYDGMSQLVGKTRYSVLYGPLLYAAVGFNDTSSGVDWRSVRPAAWHSNQWCIGVSIGAGKDPMDVGAWLKPVEHPGADLPGRPGVGRPGAWPVVPGAPTNVWFRPLGASNARITFIPHFEVQRERFTAFPFVDATGAEES